MSKLETAFSRVHHFRKKFDYTATGVVHIEIHGDLSGKITINIPQKDPIQYDWNHINIDGPAKIELAVNAAERLLAPKPRYLLKRDPDTVYFYEGAITTQGLPPGSYTCYALNIEDMTLMEVPFADVVSDI